MKGGRQSLAVPRFATPRNFDRPTYGSRVAMVAKMFGQQFMPWQQLAADIAGEIDPETGLHCYRKVVVLVPRQSGKTTEDLAQNVHAAIGYPEPRNIVYTAQTLNDARKKWAEQVKILQRSPLSQLFTIRESNGGEEIRWNNGSTHTITSNTEKAGHGKTLDKGTIDEAFAQIDRRIEQAMRPAMQTRDDAQLWVMSTAGTRASTYLNEEIEKGRETVAAQLDGDTSSRTAYIEYSADPNDDPAEEDTWWRTMPALGHTVHPDVIRGEYAEMSMTSAGLREFSRAYLNITDLGQIAGQLIEQPVWDAGGSLSRIVGPRVLALHVATDRSWAAVAWAGKNADGDDHVEVIHYERGTHWIIKYLAEKLRRNAQTTIALVARSQAGLMADDLEAAGIKVLRLSAADYAAACAEFYDGIMDGTLKHLADGNQVPLDLAIGGAAWSTGEVRVWSASKSTVEISPLVACTVAVWARDIIAAANYDALDSVG